ncbi:MAG: peptidylprolyl isomerase [Micropruina sp.]|nr:peptidylprolyl isomerase [Micropruina sp.]
MNRPGAPCTVHSFENLAKQGFYNDTSCHRLATSGLFMLQCGDPSGSLPPLMSCVASRRRAATAVTPTAQASPTPRPRSARWSAASRPAPGRPAADR